MYSLGSHYRQLQCLKVRFCNSRNFKSVSLQGPNWYKIATRGQAHLMYGSVHIHNLTMHPLTQQSSTTVPDNPVCAKVRQDMCHHAITQ